MKKNIHLTASLDAESLLCQVSSEKKEYRKSYHDLESAAFSNGHGVTGLCHINSQISDLAVPDAKERRLDSKDWRKYCSKLETIKLTVGNFLHKQAIDSSHCKTDFKEKVLVALNRARHICSILDMPFEIDLQE